MAFKPNPLIDPGESLIHRQPQTPGPNPAWTLAYQSPNMPPSSLYNQDGTTGGPNVESDAGFSYPDGSGGR